MASILDSLLGGTRVFEALEHASAYRACHSGNLAYFQLKPDISLLVHHLQCLLLSCATLSVASILYSLLGSTLIFETLEQASAYRELIT